MRMALAGFAVGVVAATGACRDSGGDDVAIDAAPPIDAAYTDCGYREQVPGDDPEVTGLTLGATAVSVCGAMEPRMPSGGLVGFEIYTLTASQAGFYRFRLESVDALGTPTQTPEGGLGALGLQVSTLHGSVTHGLYVDDQGLLLADVEAGEVTLTVYGSAPQRTSRTIAYRVSAALDTPTTRCPPAAGAADFVESHDGALHRGNDVVDFVGRLTVADTPAADDVPEPTGLTVTAGQVRKLAGTSADVAAVPPSVYRDRDTFSFATGASTHELDLHLSWPTGQANLDLMVLELPDGWLPVVALGTSIAGRELATISVRPGTSYLAWIAALDDVTAVLPVDYELTFCAR